MLRPSLVLAMALSASASIAQPSLPPHGPDGLIHRAADDYLERCVEHEKAIARQRKARKGQLSDAVVSCYREASGERPRRRLGR